MMSMNQHQRQPAQVQNENAHTSIFAFEYLIMIHPADDSYGPSTTFPSSYTDHPPLSRESGPLILVDLWGFFSSEAAPSVKIKGKMVGLTNSDN